LSFTSDILQPNEVTDYLVRLVQLRLTAVGGVQKADILGGRYFAMNLDEARPHGGAQHLASASPQRTFEKQLSLR
jgi:hypothetical protein